jgi:Uma2 family endonuclease
MPIPAELKLTYDDYLNFPNDGKRHEIIDGAHFMTPAPETRHQIVSRNLQKILVNHVEDRDLGRVLDAPIDVLLADTTVAQPDLLFVRREREGLIKRRFVEGPPDLIVEIFSPGSEEYDRRTKMKNYAPLGVPEHWLVDYEARLLEQYVLGGQICERAGVFGESFSPALFPCLTLDLRQVFKGPGF